MHICSLVVSLLLIHPEIIIFGWRGCFISLTSDLLCPAGEFVPFAAPPSTPASTTASCAATGPPTPQFSYHDINVYALAGLAPHININTSVSGRQGQTAD